MAVRQAMMRIVLAIARILSDVARANRLAAAQRQIEDLRVAGKSAIGKRLAWRPRDRISRMSLTALVDHVVEERPELGSTEFGGAVGDDLDDPFQLQVAGHRFNDTVERL